MCRIPQDLYGDLCPSGVPGIAFGAVGVVPPGLIHRPAQVPSPHLPDPLVRQFTTFPRSLNFKFSPWSHLASLPFLLWWPPLITSQEGRKITTWHFNFKSIRKICLNREEVFTKGKFEKRKRT